MSWVAASGWDTNETCEAATSTILALARSAMNRCRAGGIAWSWVPSKYQHGNLFHAGVRPLGRGHDRGRLRVDVGGEGLAEGLGVQEQVGALAPVRGGVWHGPDRRPHQAAFEPLQELLLALALVAQPAVEVDQRLHLVVADRGHRDDVAAVGVADEHDRTGQGPQEFGQVGRVASEIAKRVGEPDGAESSGLQGAELGVEAGGVGPGTVDQHDRRAISSHRRHRSFVDGLPDAATVPGGRAQPRQANFRWCGCRGLLSGCRSGR